MRRGTSPSCPASDGVPLAVAEPAAFVVPPLFEGFRPPLDAAVEPPLDAVAEPPFDDVLRPPFDGGVVEPPLDDVPTTAPPPPLDASGVDGEFECELSLEQATNATLSATKANASLPSLMALPS